VTVSMTEKIEQVEVITSVHRRRRWPAEEKAAIVQETCCVGHVGVAGARQHRIAANQRFTWRRLHASGEDVDAAKAGKLHAQRDRLRDRLAGCGRRERSRANVSGSVAIPSEFGP
jgi:transposase-like protein